MTQRPDRIERRNLTGLDDKRDRVALLLCVVLGVIVGLLAGFFADGGSSLVRWLNHSVTPGVRGGLRGDGLLWAFLGAVAAAAVFYIRVYTRKQ